MYILIIMLPLLGSIASGFFGRKIGVNGSQIITSMCIFISTILSIITFIEVGLNNIPTTIHLFRWVDLELFNVSWGFNFDSLTISMLIPVLIISFLVHIYSIGYMSHDPHNQRFFSYLSLFTFMMIILVTADNYLLMFVGWEGVGVCSYLLVSFWFTRIAANQSSMSAFLTNRVGDCFLTIGMFGLLWSFGNIDYSTVFALAPYYNENIITIIGICLLIGAMAKSSQVGLHVWLPMAMEGPTPVSALIHAATMVTAGVYLLIRSSPLIEYSSTVLLLCLWLGAITTIFSSLVGLFQQDIKKVIAYSTMSQLGMMVIAIGLSSYNIALFHLINHAFYKGLLFLGAGAVIHAVADNQDFRKYGGLIKYLPLTYSVMLIASFSLVAIPYMTGFYSKDLILESAFGQYNFSSVIVYFIATIGAMFTTLYSTKVLHLTFLSNPNGPMVNYKYLHGAHESGFFMSLPLIFLALFSIFFGYFTKDVFIGIGSAFFSDNSLFIHPLHEIMLDTEFAVVLFFKLLPFFLTICLGLIYIIYVENLPNIFIKFKLSKMGYIIYSFLNQRFLLELYYNKYITNLILKLGGQTVNNLDKGSVELLGPYGLKKFFLSISLVIDNLSTGIVTSYALYTLISLIFFLSLLQYIYIDSNILFIIIFTLYFIKLLNSLYVKSYSKPIKLLYPPLINALGDIFFVKYDDGKTEYLKEVPRPDGIPSWKSLTAYDERPRVGSLVRDMTEGQFKVYKNAAMDGLPYNLPNPRPTQLWDLPSIEFRDRNHYGTTPTYWGPKAWYPGPQGVPGDRSRAIWVNSGRDPLLSVEKPSTQSGTEQGTQARQPSSQSGTEQGTQTNTGYTGERRPGGPTNFNKMEVERSHLNSDGFGFASEFEDILLPFEFFSVLITWLFGYISYFNFCLYFCYIPLIISITIFLYRLFTGNIQKFIYEKNYLGLALCVSPIFIAIFYLCLGACTICFSLSLCYTIISIYVEPIKGFWSKIMLKLKIIKVFILIYLIFI